jgi:DNA polymerase I-like protein with 3'-5' exonuclease and polymerase domains
MIYFVSEDHKAIEIVKNDRLSRIVMCPVDLCLQTLEAMDEIGFDIETMGFDPYQDRVVCIQLGNSKVQFVVDVQTIDIQLFREILETKLLIGHNLKFDIRFLLHHRIIPTRIFDTFIAEKTNFLGIDTHRCSLADCVERYFRVVLDKSERANISGKYTLNFIIYSATDVAYLHELKEVQEKKIAENKCEMSIKLDNKFVIVLAYIEYCGMKLDVEKWTERLNAVKAEEEIYHKELDDFIISNKYKEFINRQYDMFNPDTKVKINWNSSQQVLKLFHLMGVNTEVVEKGEVKHTTESGQLIGQIDKFPILETYIKYKECQKNIGTYGENWFAMINPVSGRIHTQYKQLMNTGRLSSGGKNRGSGEVYPNFQNIPSDKETRSCFVAEEGNVLIGCDYTGQEQIVLANKSLDESLLAFYANGGGEMHSFIASKIYPDELAGLTLEEIKTNHKDKRQIAKAAGFAINYGGQGKTIADNLGIPEEQGNQIYDAYFMAFPGLKSYFDKAKQFGVANGYILISSVTGKRSYVPFYQEYQELKKEINKEFWDKYKQHKLNNTPTYAKMKEKIKKFYGHQGTVERMSLNFPIQGESAEITKLAGIYFWEKFLLPNNLAFTVKFINAIHDEYLLECPESLSEECAEELKKAMETAGDKFCKIVKLKAEPKISSCWEK